MIGSGEFAALLTACFWTVTALSFEAAGKRVGSLVVNLVRLFIAIVFISIYTGLTRGCWLPLDATPHQWIWLLLSGLVGFVIGDLFLFKAFILISARTAMLIMSSVPILTTLIDWCFLGEKLQLGQYAGMALTISGISIVLSQKSGAVQTSRKLRLTGVLFAFGGAIGQAAGLVLSKYGMGSYNAFSATQIRIVAGILGFCLVFSVLKRWRRIGRAFNDLKAMKQICMGAFFGPFLGVSFSLLAVQKTATGVASTIMSIVPILIIPPSVLIFKQSLKPTDLTGALLAVAGVAVLFLL